MGACAMVAAVVVSFVSGLFPWFLQYGMKGVRYHGRRVHTAEFMWYDASWNMIARRIGIMTMIAFSVCANDDRARPYYSL